MIAGGLQSSFEFLRRSVYHDNDLTRRGDRLKRLPSHRRHHMLEFPVGRSGRVPFSLGLARRIGFAACW
jgi:hypothetical protein